MADQSIIVRLRANIDDFRRGLNEASALAERQSRAMQKVGRVGMGMGLALAAGVAVSARAAIEWESAWAGVTKTVDGNAEQMGVLEDQLRSLATTLPASHVEIAAVAEGAGQLGVKRENIASFTKTMVDLGQTTNLSADEAATSIAQMANIMGTSAGEIDNLGATLVALGNDGASTEKDIMSMALRLSGAGKLIGASEADVLGMSNAMASMGIEAELGGGSMSRTMQKIYSAVKSGGAEVEKFAGIAGVSAADFTESFSKDPIKTVDLFVRGLDRIDQSGGNVVKALGDVGITGTQDLSVLLRLKGAGDLLNHSLTVGADAWQANTALLNEANKRYATTESQMKIAKNNVHDLAITLGTVLLPAITKASHGVRDFSAWLNGLPEPVHAAFMILATLAATVGVLGGGALIVVPKLLALRAALRSLGVSVANTDRVLRALGLTLKAGLIAGAVLGVALAVDQLVSATAKSGPGVNALTDSLADFGREGRATSELLGIVGNDFELIGKKIADAGKNKWLTWDDASKITGYRNELDALDKSLAGLVQGGNADLAEEAFGRIAAQAAAEGVSVEDLNARFLAYQEALRGTAADSKLAADGTDAVGTAASEAAPQVQELTDAQQALQTALSGFVDPLGAYQELLADKETAEQESAQATADSTKSSKDSWKDYAEDVEVSLNELATKLEEDNLAHEQWETNLIKVAKRTSPEVAEILGKMSEEGIDLTAKMANGTTKEVKRMAAALIENAQIAGDGMGTALDNKLQVLSAIAKSGGKATVKELADSLKIGVGEVRGIAAEYGIKLSEGINPVLDALGKSTIKVSRPENNRGGRAFAEGGFEDHSAQIAPAGAWRVWAEPETGGEAYIPLARSKRARSVDIWRETGRRLGQEPVLAMASGGYADAAAVPAPPSAAA